VFAIAIPPRIPSPQLAIKQGTKSKKRTKQVDFNLESKMKRLSIQPDNEDLEMKTEPTKQKGHLKSARQRIDEEGNSILKYTPQKSSAKRKSPNSKKV